MRIGLFGGSFDPPHVGHLILAERCREAAALDEVWFMPSYQPPHKLGQKLTRFETRCELVELAVISQPLFRVSRIEGELPPPSYTAETLRTLRQTFPEHEFHVILGGDSLADLPQWYHPERIVALAGLIAVSRPGVTCPSAEELASRIGVDCSEIRLQEIESPLVEISSTEIRQRVAEGKSIRYLVPRPVEEMVREKRLYSS